MRSHLVGLGALLMACSGANQPPDGPTPAATEVVAQAEQGSQNEQAQQDTTDERLGGTMQTSELVDAALAPWRSLGRRQRGCKPLSLD